MPVPAFLYAGDGGSPQRVFCPDERKILTERAGVWNVRIGL